MKGFYTGFTECLRKKNDDTKVIVSSEQYKLTKAQIVIFGDKDSVLFNKAYSPSGVKVETRHYDSNSPDTITIIVY